MALNVMLALKLVKILGVVLAEVIKLRDQSGAARFESAGTDALEQAKADLLQIEKDAAVPEDKHAA